MEYGTTTPADVTAANSAFYTAWAPTYDSDGNVLQQIDSAAFAAHVIPLLRPPPSAATTTATATATAAGGGARILDLGCGTGRNTATIAQHAPPGTRIIAADACEAMLASARARIASTTPTVEVEWVNADLAALQLGQIGGEKVDGVVSTLVLEHVARPEVFFAAVARVVRPGGWVWVTDMHPQMGSSRASFWLSSDPPDHYGRGQERAKEHGKEAGKGQDGGRKKGTKVSGVSWNHALDDVLGAALAAGLRLQGDVVEMGVGDEAQAARLGVRAQKWLGVEMLSGMMFRMA